MSAPAIAQPASRGLEALVLLLATGVLIGAVFPVTKIAQQAGVTPLPWAFAVVLGAGLILTAIANAKGAPVPLTGRYLRYFAISGLISIAVPNLVLFIVLPPLGAGLASVVYTLPPILTLLLALAVRIERPDVWRAAGIGLGLVGALTIVGPRGSLPSPDLAAWMALAFVIPASVAAGNVYRTVAWPPGAKPMALAAGTMLGGAVWVALAILAAGRVGELSTLSFAPGLGALQIALNALTYVLYFRLQVVAGPVYLSQIGYVATAVGLATGTLMFGERYSLWVWGGAAVIVAGVLLVSFGRKLARHRPAR